MKTPIPPPARQRDLLSNILRPDRLLATLSSPTLAQDPEYHPWEWFFRHEPPTGFTREEWWTAVRSRRAQTERSTPFRLTDGRLLTYNLPDRLLRLIDDVSTRARGQVELPEPIANTSTRRGYLVRSLIEEAITSSQLEGASTSRVRAKEMLREKQAPRDRSERMILNNYNAMQRIVDLQDEPLSPKLIREIHRIVTEGTLDDASDAGRIQRPGDARVRIYGTDTEEQILHLPPDAATLEERMAALCQFANETDLPASSSDPYMPPLLRAITLHFMMGYDHYFADGNGRTARAVFYWSMLHQGFFLTEFLSISRLLKNAPARYARSFLYTEQDEGDLTYFFLSQAHVVSRAIHDLDTYLERKTTQIRETTALLRDLNLNHRQIEVVQRFLRDPGSSTSVEDHRSRHAVVPQTARTDLQDLERRGLLLSRKQGRKTIWFPVSDLATRARQFEHRA